MAQQKFEKPFTVSINRFRTWNTQDSPVSMPDTDVPINLNLMHIGTALWTIKGYSDTINTVPAGLNIVRMYRGWLNGVICSFAFCDDGSLYQFEDGFQGTRIEVAPAGTFINPKFAQWKTERILIIDTNGYYSYDGTTLTHETTGVPGTAIAIWKGRVWIAHDSRTIMFSAPDIVGNPGYKNFDVTFGAGAISDSYASLGSIITAFAPTKEYLYVIGDEGSHVIYGLQTLDSATTVFNLDEQFPGIGTPYPDSITIVGDTAYFINERGVYAFAGLSYDSASALLDGIFPNIQLSFSPYSAFALIRNKSALCFLVSVLSPIDYTVQKWFLVFSDNRWFPAAINTGLEGNSLDVTAMYQAKYLQLDTTFIATGNEIRTMFNGSSVLRKKVRTKSMNFGLPQFDKQAVNVGVTIYRDDCGLISPTVFIASSPNGPAKTLTFDPPQDVTFLNDAGNIATLLNDANQNVTAYIPFGDLEGLESIEGGGKRLAIDFEELSADQYSITELLLEAQKAGEWA